MKKLIAAMVLVSSPALADSSLFDGLYKQNELINELGEDCVFGLYMANVKPDECNAHSVELDKLPEEIPWDKLNRDQVLAITAQIRQRREQLTLMALHTFRSINRNMNNER